MFILNEGREAFNKFMTTVLTQIIYGGISLLVLYRATKLPVEFKTVVFYSFTFFLLALFAFWIISTYKEFIGSYQFYLKSKLPNLDIATHKLMVRDIWNEDRRLALEYTCIIILTIGVLVFVLFGSGLSAAQIAETIKMK